MSAYDNAYMFHRQILAHTQESSISSFFILWKEKSLGNKLWDSRIMFAYTIPCIIFSFIQQTLPYSYFDSL